MNINFDPIKHEYLVDGKLFPSVTQVLQLANEYKNVNKDVLKKAANLGTAIHKTTELFDQDNLKENTLDPLLYLYLEGWKKFLKETGFKIFSIEEITASLKYEYAGTMDRIGFLNGKNVLLDIKSGSTIPKTTGLQLAAYANAYNEITGNKIDQRICIHLKPNKYSMKLYDDKTDFDDFKCFLKVYKWGR